jgi:hypothetical protein
MAIDAITALVSDIGALDWDNLATVTAANDKLLTALDSDRTALRELVERAIDNPHLLRLCEHYDILDKIVLHDDPSGWRLRLHVFLSGYFDRPHNHRWTYSSRILHGSYIHALYGTEDQLGNGDIDVAVLQPRMVRTESASDFYTLHHTMIHSVTAQPTPPRSSSAAPRSRTGSLSPTGRPDRGGGDTAPLPNHPRKPPASG